MFSCDNTINLLGILNSQTHKIRIHGTYTRGHMTTLQRNAVQCIRLTNQLTKSDPPRPKSKQKRTVHYQKHVQRFVHDREPKQRKSMARNVQNGKAKFRIIIFCTTVFYSSNTNLKDQKFISHALICN